MTIYQLNKVLRDLLKKFIMDSDHIDTGALYRSIVFTCRATEDGLQINFNSEYYIKYLEDGDFVNKFLKLDSVSDAIGDYIVSETFKTFPDR